jgi:hypothetical protein
MIVGTETFTMTQSGTGTTLTSRSDTGNGTYLISAHGPGPTPGPGSYSYDLQESGNYLVGSLCASNTGSDRYSLLEAYNDPSTGMDSDAKGAVDFSQFGAPLSAAGIPQQLPSGSNALSVSSPFDASNPGAAVAAPLDGTAAIGAKAQAQYVAPGPELYKRYCFAAGTPLLTPTGHKTIELFQIGDTLLAASEGDPYAAVEVSVVEEVFSNFALVINLHVGGKLIRTTAEHLFYAWGRGWTAAAELKAGDRLRDHNDKEGKVEAVTSSGEETVVFNLRVGQLHTYFVGALDWFFSAWAHNAYAEGEVVTDQAELESVEPLQEAAANCREETTLDLSNLDKPNKKNANYDARRTMEEKATPTTPAVKAKDISKQRFYDEKMDPDQNPAAAAQIEGEEIQTGVACEGRGSTPDLPDGVKPGDLHPTFCVHAEGKAAQRAVNAATGDVAGKTMKVYVEKEPCAQACNHERGLAELAKKTGMDIIVYYPKDGQIYKMTYPAK